MNDDSIESLLTARESVVSPPVILRSGELRVLFVDGDLRYLEASGTEVVRRVYVAVRDLDWNTLPGLIEDLEIEDYGDSFQVTFARRHRFADLDYRWSAAIVGDRTGRIRYEMSGEALSRFSYAKIGICVHHPIKGFKGMAYSGVSPGGPLSGTLPDTIGPQVHLSDGTDLPLFDPVSELRLSHSGSGVVAFEFSGDLWEMEDQRNWTDQSFKSASTPAALGYRHEAALGQLFHQTLVITTNGFNPGARPTADYVRVGPPSSTVVPAIGLICATPTEALSPAARDLLALVRPAHVRFDVDLDADAEELIAMAAGRAADLQVMLELAVFVTEGEGYLRDLARLREAVGKFRPLIARVLLFSKNKESTSAELAQSGVRELGSFPDVPLVVGSNANFNELNRNRVRGPVSGLVWSMNPQVHASDELSLVENLQAQAETVTTAMSFAPGLSLHVSPVTLRPRYNAVASTGAEFKPGGLPWNIDARQASLFAASWTLGSVAMLANAGTESLTYYELVGPRGLIGSPGAAEYPQTSPSLADTAYPVAILLADVCSLQGARLLHVSGFDPLRVAALACESPAGRTLLLANLTRGEVTLPATDVGASGRLRVLDASNLRQATAKPQEFLGSGQELVGAVGTIQVHLGPYACARLDTKP